MSNPATPSPVRPREGLFGITTENPAAAFHLKRRLSGFLIIPEEHEEVFSDPVVHDEAALAMMDTLLEQFPKPPRTLPTTVVVNRNSRSATTEKDPAPKSNWAQGLKGFAERWTMGFTK